MTEKMKLDDARRILDEKFGDYLNRHYDIPAESQNGKKPILCPFHLEKTGSMSVDFKKNRFHCFGCGKEGGLFRWIAAELGQYDEYVSGDKNALSNAFKKACQEFDIEILPDHNQAAEAKQKQEEAQNRAKWILKCAGQYDLSPAESYLEEERKIEHSVCSAFNIGYYRSKKYDRDCLIIPLSPTSYVTRFLQPLNDGRDGKPGTRFKFHGDAVPFNAQGLYDPKAKAIFIVEGQIDAMSILSARRDESIQAVALGGKGTTRYLKEMLSSRPAAAPIVIALDNSDDVTDKDFKKIEEAIAPTGAQFVRLPKDFYPSDCKDMNDCLKRDKEAFGYALSFFADEIDARLADKQEEELHSYEIEASMKVFSEMFEQYVRDHGADPTTTGFKKLDQALSGGFYPGLYILGAINSLGKTTLALQIADAFAENGKDVLFFCLEMSRSEMLAKSLSRLTYTTSKDRQTVSSLDLLIHSRFAALDEFQQSAFRVALKHYQERIGGNFFLLEGMGSINVNKIWDAVERHKRLTGKSPAVIVDYLQILSSPDDIKATTEKQAIDRSVLELKRLSREYETPVLAISSLNRAAYKDGQLTKDVSTTSFKESGGIEYSADVLLGLDFYIEEGETNNESDLKAQTDRPVKITILKNRRGAVGSRIEYRYHTIPGCFEEYDFISNNRRKNFKF